MQRRRFLRGIALVTAAGVAGCSGDGGDGEDGGDGGTDTPTPTPTPTATATPTESTDATTEPAETTTEPAETTAEGTTAADVTEVTVAPGGSLRFEPEDLTVPVGETVRWVWDGGGHNVVVESKPEGSTWEGDDAELYSSGHTHEHEFGVAGEYSYYCNPHRGSGMVGTVTVEE